MKEVTYEEIYEFIKNASEEMRRKTEIQTEHIKKYNKTKKTV